MAVNNIANAARQYQLTGLNPGTTYGVRISYGNPATGDFSNWSASVQMTAGAAVTSSETYLRPTSTPSNIGVLGNPEPAPSVHLNIDEPIDFSITAADTNDAAHWNTLNDEAEFGFSSLIIPPGQSISQVRFGTQALKQGTGVLIVSARLPGVANLIPLSPVEPIPAGGVARKWWFWDVNPSLFAPDPQVRLDGIQIHARLASETATPSAPGWHVTAMAIRVQLDAALPAPTGLSVTQTSEGGEIFTWTAVTGAASYKLYSRVVGTTNWLQEMTSTVNSIVTDRGQIEAGVNWEFSVTAVDADGVESARSNVVTQNKLGFTLPMISSVAVATPPIISPSNIQITLPTIPSVAQAFAPTISTQGNSVIVLPTIPSRATAFAPTISGAGAGQQQVGDVWPDGWMEA
jgi:hypothetical protein